MTKITTPHQSARIGSQVTLGVVSDVDSPYRFIWRRNGHPVAGGDKSYVVRNLRSEDLKAVFTVSVLGMYGTEDSEPFTLEEAWAKPATSMAATQTAAQAK